RDRLLFEGMRLPADAVEAAPCWLNSTNIRRFGALARASQMAGAFEAIANRSIAYASERQQFGRPIGEFQAIRHRIVVLAEKAAQVALAAKVAAHSSGGEFEVAAAKSIAADAAMT